MYVSSMLIYSSTNTKLLEKAFVRFPFSSLFPASPGLLVLDTSNVPPLPIPLKLGDANLDGFPDFLAISTQSKNRVPHLVYSVPCSSGVAGCDQNGRGRRGWKLARKGVESLEAIKDARGLTFLDMDEDVNHTNFLCCEMN